MATTMTPMAHPLPLPVPSIYPPTINHFCPHLQIEAIGVRRASGQYYAYCYDYTQKKFAPLPCLGCQPETTERHLYPKYAEYCKELDAHVCFAFNSLSCKVEQFVFEQTTGGFEEVHRPEMVYDTRRPLADILCVVKETEEYGMVVIQRDVAHGFKKSKTYNTQDLSLPPVRVKTLMVQKLDDLPMTPIEAEEFRPSFPNPNNEFTFLLQSCPRYPRILLVCVLQEDQSLLRFHFSEQTGDFHPVKCPECTGPVTENFLRPLYAAHSKALGEHVIFVENLQNFRLEQYVFCESRRGFKQVEDMSLVFDHRLIEHGKVVLKKKTGNGAIHLSRTYGGFMQKMMFVENRESQKIPPTEVRTFAIQMKEEETQRKKREQMLFPAGDPLASYKDYLIKTMQLTQSQARLVVTLAALEQQQQLILANVPVPVTVTPESESADSEVDDESDSEESDSESGSEDCDSDSGLKENDSASNDAEPDSVSESKSKAEVKAALQKEAEAQKACALKMQFKAVKVPAPSTVPPETESNDSKIDDEAGSGENESESGADSGPEDAGSSSDGSFEKVYSEAGEDSKDSDDSDLEDYDTCDDQ